MLAPYRVLDLTDEHGQLCGQILGDLGADVILVEPPGGSNSRRRGPFYRNQNDPNCSLNFWAFNRNKRSITLDLDDASGRERLQRLVEGADFLIESARPGYLAERSLAYSDLAAINPALIYVSISPFGQEGPKARNAESDLTLIAASGPLMLQGDEDRAPIRIGVPQAYLHAGADAAAAALIAHHERVRSGLGQHIDVSGQEATAIAAFSQPLVPALGASPARRTAGGARVGHLRTRQVWPARDGYVVLVLWFGPAIAPATQRLMQCMFDQGFCDAATRDRDWTTYDARLLSGEVPGHEFEELKAIVERFTRSFTKQELMQMALERALLIAPVATIKEVVESPQLAAREFWQRLYHPELAAHISYPGAFARFSASPITYRRRPPTIGEHNAEILDRASDDHAIAGWQRGRADDRPVGSRADSLPLRGLKVVDLFWAMAGPATTRVLADYGATVLRIESRRRLDTCRTIAPYFRNQPDIEHSGIFMNLNAGKLGIALDLGTKGGREVFRDLVGWADLVCENFSPRAMRGWGLHYEALRQIKPGLIMVSSCLMGQTGPYAKFAGYGALAAAMCGFGNLCGWPGRPPAGPYGSYTDCVAPRFTVAAVLAALDYRRRTGLGQYIELSQAEASMHFLTPALLDFTANGEVQLPGGNRDPYMAPHGVYPCAGDESWIAIACVNDEQWFELRDLINCENASPDLLQCSSLAERLERQDELDSVIAHWTQTFSAAELELILQARGIPASKVSNSTDLDRDPQLRWRHHFVDVDHPVLGKIPVERSSYTLSRTPDRVMRSSPILGGDTSYVLENILGYSRSRIEELTAQGVLR